VLRGEVGNQRKKWWTDGVALCKPDNEEEKNNISTPFFIP
jgi:hypothetical protein